MEGASGYRMLFNSDQSNLITALRPCQILMPVSLSPSRVPSIHGSEPSIKMSV